MDITEVGRNIRRLRRERDITQEQLADNLGVSYQAVSKWERCEAVPDIALIPPLAIYFNVRTDELFGMEQERRAARVAEIYKEHMKNLLKKGSQADIAYMKDAVTEFPHEYMLWMEYGNLLGGLIASEPPSEEQLREALTVFDKVIENSAEHPRFLAVLERLKAAMEM